MPSSSPDPKVPLLLKPSRIPYLDSLRSLSIIAVVLLHAAAWDWYLMPVTGLDWQTLNVYDSLVRFCVPVFFMVSGALFLQPERGITIQLVFRKYLPRILVAFIVWSAFYAALGTYGPGGDGSVRSLLTRLVLGHYHLWFLFVLAGLYLVTPLLRPMVSNRTNAWYFVVLAAVFTLFMPLAQELPVVGDLVTQILETTQMHLVLGYTLFFVLGYLLSTVTLTRKRVVLVMLLGIWGVLMTAGLTSLLSIWKQTPTATFYGFLTPNVAAAAVAVFVGVRALNTRKDPAGRAPKPIVALVGTLSFGIYLVHPFFQWVYQQLGITASFAPTVISVPLLTLMIIVPSAVMAWLVQRIPKVGAYIS